MADSSRNVLEVRGLKKFFPIRRGFLQRIVGQVRAVDDVNFDVTQGETLALVGESGCGKTTTWRCILRALDPTDGQIRFRMDNGSMLDIASLPRQRLRPVRKQMQMIFQDPFSSLNPRMTLLDIVGEPLLVNGVTDRSERIDRVSELLKLVGLRPEYMRRYPHAFSGCQRQRIGIARALALHPRLVVADEPVSALDVSVQAQVLNLLLELEGELGLTYLFVAHDLSVVKHISDRVAVMYVGQIVEIARLRSYLYGRCTRIRPRSWLLSLFQTLARAPTADHSQAKLPIPPRRRLGATFIRAVRTRWRRARPPR